MPESKLKIVFLSMHYAPEPCATRTTTLARDMAAMGHDCSVLTTFPNYPHGRVYDGYRQRPVDRKREHGVELIRVPMKPDHSLSVRKRGLSYLSFMLSASTLGLFTFRRPDVMWVYHPPLTTGIAGLILSKLRRVPYVYEITDVWPDTLVSTGMIQEGRITRAILKVCQRLYRHADAIVVTSEGMKRRVIAQGAAPEKVHTVYYWVDEDIFRPTPRDPSFHRLNGFEGRFNVVFAGNLGTAQGLDSVLDAARLLATRSPEVQFHLVGEGVAAAGLQDRVEREGLSNVRFHGQHPVEEMPKFYASADAVLMTLKDDRLFRDTIPSKLQGYMAAGRPVLNGVAGDAAEVVAETGCGLNFPPENAEGLAAAVEAMVQMPAERLARYGEAARTGYENLFSRASSLRLYERIFHAVKSGDRLPILGSAVANVELRPEGEAAVR